MFVFPHYIKDKLLFSSDLWLHFRKKAAIKDFKSNFGIILWKSYLAKQYLPVSSWKLTPKYFLSCLPQSNLLSNKSALMAYKKNVNR